MGFYDEMAAMASDLLKPDSQGGLGQGAITLTRVTTGTVDDTKPWEPPSTTTNTITIRGAVRGIDTRLVGTEMGGAVLLASDRQAICETPDMMYTAGDVLSVDGSPVYVLAVENIPAAGVVAAVKFTVRG